jgi:N-acetyl-anhydromuramyl-L-alanine amidase AmpD
MPIRPLVVIHESLTSYNQTLAYCQSGLIKGSYHTLIKLDGSIVRLVDPSMKCHGAGPSSSQYPHGQIEEVNGSVDPFAYHVCLISPMNADEALDEHEGYTDEQYESLAWLLSRTGLPWERFATHISVDDSGTVKDPRSLDTERLFYLWQAIGPLKEIWFGFGGD